MRCQESFNNNPAAWAMSLNTSTARSEWRLSASNTSNQMTLAPALSANTGKGLLS
jgi:hypothetical protein